jgi:hypothetical protein
MSSSTAKYLSPIGASLILFAILSGELAPGTVTAIEVIECPM